LSEDQNQVYDAAVSIETVADPCPVCNGRGIIVDSSQPVVFAHPCQTCQGSWNEQERRNKAAERISAANIPSVLAKGLDISINRPEILQWMEAARGGVRKDLFLYGPPGTGKSVLAVTILADFLKVQQTVFYLDAASFVRDVRKCHNSRHVNKIGDGLAATINEIQRRLRHFEIVVIDNLGRGSSITEFTLDTYSELVERRHETGKLTIWVSNHGPSSALDSLDGKNVAAKIGEIAANKVLAAVCINIICRSDKIPKAENVDFSIVNFRVRGMSQDESTLLNIWSRLGLFRMISTRERARLTRPSEIDSTQIIEIPEAREFVAWGHFLVIQSGAVVCHKDCAVLIGILQIYHQGGKDGMVAFSLAALADALQIKSRGAPSVLTSLRRSLYRLAESKVRIKAPNNSMIWIGGFIDSIKTEGQNTRMKIVIRLNEFLVQQYRDNLYSYLSIASLVGLKTLYSQGVYRFLLSHRDDYKFIGLSKWRSILGVSSELADKEFRRKIRMAVVELIQIDLLTFQSRLDENDILHTYLSRNLGEVNAAIGP
jgi:DNA replication protein DnaC